MLKKYESQVSTQTYMDLLQDIEDEKFRIIFNLIEQKLKDGTLNVDDVEDEILQTDLSNDVVDRLFNNLLHWRTQYPTVQTLKKLANDSQNVHTEVVSNQTQGALDLLAQITVNKCQRTLDEIATIWSFNPSIAKRLTPVYNDMKYWADKSYIINPDDYLYRRTIRGLWSKIKSFDQNLQSSLIQRLWEECEESVGMCAQGHLSRLANVLVGFDEDFKSPQSPMEVLQDAMALLANSDVTLENKLIKANTIMDTLSMSQEQRQPWLDAL